MQYKPTDSTERQLLRSLSYFSSGLNTSSERAFSASGRQVLLLASLCSFDEPPSSPNSLKQTAPLIRTSNRFCSSSNVHGYVTLSIDENDSRTLSVEPTKRARTRAALIEDRRRNRHAVRDIPKKMLPPALMLWKTTEGLKELI